MMSPSLRDRVVGELGKVVVNKERETELLLSALLAGGHVLLEGVPGVSKTLLTKTFSRCLELDFQRVQFTPDMLPLDIVGGFIFDLKEREFEFRRGPVFTNILLADEINRAPPKVQSALLESMQEGQVTIEGHTEALPSPHMVIATQNPIEFQGVYPLPEGQLDRFMLKITLGYPSPETESEVIRRNILPSSSGGWAPMGVVSRLDLAQCLREVEEVKVSDEVIGYVARLAQATRSDGRVALGASPRAVVHLARCARARAYIAGRGYVTPDDVKQLAVESLSHRLRLKQSVELSGDGVTVASVIRDVVDGVEPPR